MHPLLLSLLAFVSTNIDDIFLLMLLYGSNPYPSARWQILLGQYIGMATLTIGSMVGAHALTALADRHIALLGLIPMFLGIRALFTKADEDAATPAAARGLWIQTALLTLSGGADNLGLYIPLFAGFSSNARLTALLVFLLMTGLWSAIALYFSRLPRMAALLDRHRDTLMPIVLIFLGLYILHPLFLS